MSNKAAQSEGARYCSCNPSTYTRPGEHAYGCPYWTEHAYGRPVVAGGQPTRSAILEEADEAINGDRNSAYGDPSQDFERTASMWTAMGLRFGPEHAEVERHHVAMAMVALKLSRLAWNPSKRDSWVDIAGYAGCGAEAAGITDEGDAE